MILAHRQAATRAALEAQRVAEAPPVEPTEPAPVEAPPPARTVAAKPAQQPRR